MKKHKNRNPHRHLRSSSRFAMLPLLSCLLFLGIALPGLAADRDNLDRRIRTLTDKFEAIQAKPRKAIPPEVLRKAQGIILLDGTRAGFLFAYHHAGVIALFND